LIKNIVFGIALSAFVASTAFAQVGEKYAVISKQLVDKANVELSAEKASDAQLLFERALVADPANTAALLGLGRAHEAQGRIGRGLKYYRQALEITPNDVVALEAQALAFLKREMFDRADGNRAKLVRLCPNGCEALESVETAIEAFLAKESDQENG
jgi:tetratricopeptide (TPR) repeat protein